jgi:hypothetical protein
MLGGRKERQLAVHTVAVHVVSDYRGSVGRSVLAYEEIGAGTTAYDTIRNEKKQ